MECHVQVCSRDFLMAMWALASWIVNAKVPTRVILHDDGTLRASQRRAFCSLFPNGRFIERQEADAHMSTALKDRKACWQLRRACPFGIKLFDFALMGESPFYVSMDSDVLLFEEPTELLRPLDDTKDDVPCVYMPDVQHSYSLSDATISTIVGGTEVAAVCAGFGLVRRDAIDLSWVEKILSEWPQILDVPGFAEQTVVALNLMINGGRVLSDDYLIPSGAGSEDAVVKHYVRGIREQFWIDGVPRIADRVLSAKLEGSHGPATEAGLQ